jgi:hypothetical protein
VEFVRSKTRPRALTEEKWGVVQRSPAGISSFWLWRKQKTCNRIEAQLEK